MSVLRTNGPLVYIAMFSNPLYKSPGVHTGQAPGQGSLAPLQVIKSGERLQDHRSSGILQLVYNIFLYYISFFNHGDYVNCYVSC